MNNYNSNQKLPVINNPESLGGGAGGSGFGNDSSGDELRPGRTKRRRGSSQPGTQYSIKVTNPDKEVTTAPEVEDGAKPEGGEVNPELNLEALPDLNETPEEEVIEVVGESNEGVEEGVEEIEFPALDDIENEYPFQIDSETGLSSQLTNIKALESQLQDLEEGSSGYEEIKSSIENDRSQEKIEFETSLEENNKKLSKIYTTLYTKGKGTGSFTGNEEQMVIINNYLVKLKSNSKYSKQATQIEDTISSIKSNIDTLTTQLSYFNTETQSQIAEAIQSQKDTLQTELSQAQQEYNGSEAEAFDTKILLERQLEGQLTDPNNLFSQDNINQIFATYGLKEGRDRLKQLQEQSDKAREQAARNEIQDEIVSHIHHHLDSGRSLFQKELVDAISLDMQSQLEVLLEESEKNSEEYREINRVLQSSGEYRISEIVNSQNPKLQELVFWYKVNLDDGKTTAEILGDDKNNNLAQYVAKETDRQFKEQELEIKKGVLDGQGYLHSRLDNKRRGEIDSRIESQFNTAKTNEINKLNSEISGLESTTDYYSSDSQDKLMLAEKEALRPYDVTQFNAELQKELESGQITFEKGHFNSVENIPARNAEINGQLDSLSNETKSLIKNSDQISPDLKQRLQNLEIEQQRQAIQGEIDSISSRRRFKWFGIGKKKAESLTSLLNQVNANLITQNQFKTQVAQNQEQYQKISVNISRLKELYNKLPNSIQLSLKSLENTSGGNISTTIDTAVQELQSYETPVELQAQRDKIAELQKQIKELEGIK
jgi:hypothetical protein